MAAHTFLPGVLLLASGAVLVVATLHDVAARTIPDTVSALLLLAGLLLRWQDDSLALGGMLAVAVFSACAILFQFNLLGGGDVKLLGAASILIPPAGLPGMLTAVALWGGALALLYLLLRWAVPRIAPLPPLPARPRLQSLLRRALRAESWRIRRRGSLPYGSAIAAGVITTFLTGASP